MLAAELLLETVRPTIGIGHEGGTLDEQGRLYDTPTLSFVVELADADAGLQAASVTVNEERLLQERWVRNSKNRQRSRWNCRPQQNRRKTA
ncbi:MAG: hypothetical protein ACLVJ6_00325 [Merdibacter sp.]